MLVHLTSIQAGSWEKLIVGNFNGYRSRLSFHEFEKPQTVPNLPPGEAGTLTGTPPLAAMLQTDLRGMGRAEQTRQAGSLTGTADSEKAVCPWPEVQNGFILFVNTEILLSHLGNSNFTEKESCSC